MIVRYIMIVLTALMMLFVAFLLGALYTARRFEEGAVNDFCEVQHIRDENARLRKENENIRKALDDVGIVI